MNSQTKTLRFETIPVMDLMGGEVVRAKRGERHAYQPIVSKLCHTADPIDIAQNLSQLYPFKSLYIADLDAIQRRGTHAADVEAIRRHLPQVEIWVDAGVATMEQCRPWLDMGVLCVIGSESQHSMDSAMKLLDEIGDDRAILSLDFSNGGPAGPADLFLNASHWPLRIIGMTLGRVGSYSGPDLEILEQLRSKAPDRKIYAAGGVRNFADIQHLAAMNIDGALIASALHDGILTAEHLTHLSE